VTLTSLKFFEEPKAPDPTFAGRKEGLLGWLGRSTHPRAAACRRFLNSNLNSLPQEYAASIHSRLLEDGQHWHAAFFEMIVGRTLQSLGAELEIEPEMDGSTLPDFKASFEGFEVVVEATAPVFFRQVQEEMGRKNALAATIEELAPEGWVVVIDEIPDLGPSDSKREFKRVVRQLLDVPPPRPGEEQKKLRSWVGHQSLELTLSEFDDPTVKIGAGPGMAFWGDGVETIRKAVRRKRSQVRHADVPAILAINAPEIFSGLRDFDQALFGRRHQVFSVEKEEIVEDRFVADGVLDPCGEAPPTFAGVLAYVEAGFFCSRDPVLYVHPRFAGALPPAFSRLERRTLVPGEGISILPREGASVLEALGPVNLDET